MIHSGPGRRVGSHIGIGGLAPSRGNLRELLALGRGAGGKSASRVARRPLVRFRPARGCIARARAGNPARFRNVDKTRSQEKRSGAELFLASSFVHIAKTGFRARPRNTRAGGVDCTRLRQPSPMDTYYVNI